MPLALDPSETYEVSLLADEAKPPAARPVFLFRYMAHSASRRHRKLLEEYEALRELPVEGERKDPKDPQSELLPGPYWTLKQHDGLMDRIFDSLAERLAGWRGLSVPFDAKSVADVLTDAEALSLMRRAQNNSTPTPAEKNASGSPSPSDTPNSAPAVAALATTGPAPTSPFSSNAAPAAAPAAPNAKPDASK